MFEVIFGLRRLIKKHLGEGLNLTYIDFQEVSVTPLSSDLSSL